MDGLACAGLAAIEGLVLRSFIEPHQSWSSMSVVALLFSFQYVVAKYYRFFLYHKYFSPLRNLPGPENNHWLFGQSLNFLKTDSPSELYVKWMREWPDAPMIRYLTFSNDEVLVCNSLASFKDVLGTYCYDFVRPPRWVKMVSPIFGRGLLVAGEDEHRAHRKMLAGSFSVPNIRRLEPVFQETAKEVTNLLERAIADNPDQDGTGVFNPPDAFGRFTLDIIGKTILGVELGSLDAAAAAADGRREKASASEGEYTFHRAYEAIVAPGTMLGNVLLFVSGFVPAIRWLPLRANREFQTANHWVDRVLLALIRERKREVYAASRDGKYEQKASGDVLTFICEGGLPGGPAEGLSEENILGHIKEFMVGGVDTSSNMLSWAVYTMATRHDIQEALRKEISDMVAHNPNPTFAEIETLPYFNGFVRDVLRVYSPATSTHRHAARDLVIDGVAVPRGTNIDIVFSLPMLNPLIWGEDATAVDPARWQPARLTALQQSPWAFEAFSNGPHGCIGRVFALLEIKTILVEMVRRYRFVEVIKAGRLENPSFVLKPSGMEVRLERITA